MNLELTDNRKVAIDMTEQIDDAIKIFGEEISGEVSTPAQRDLFMVDMMSPKLQGKEKEACHSTSAKILYIMKRA